MFSHLRYHGKFQKNKKEMRSVKKYSSEVSEKKLRSVKRQFSEVYEKKCEVLKNSFQKHKKKN